MKINTEFLGNISLEDFLSLVHEELEKVTDEFIEFN